MRIGIDARFYGPRQKGLGRYIQKLIEGLENTDSANQYFIFLRKQNWEAYRSENKNFKKILADYRWYTFSEQILMPFKIRRAKIDLMYFPHFNVPIFYSKPFVITIHDLILKRFPTRRASALSPLLYLLKNFAYHLTIYSAIKRAKKIIAVSDYTKKDILRYFRVAPEKIQVIYEGASDKLEVTDRYSSLSNKFNISKPYLLYVGNAYPHKNLEKLVLAFDGLSADTKENLQLVLVGESDYFYQRLQEEIVGVKNIVFTDFVSDNELALLYNNAFLYVFPSLCEGFGLPPLEAMTYGLPVASSRASCLPEILGQAAIYFDPEDVREITQKIQSILDNQKNRRKLIQRGFEKIKEYNWTKMACEVLEIFEAVD